LIDEEPYEQRHYLMIMMYDCIAIFCERLYERMRFASWVICMVKEPRISIQHSARLANGDKEVSDSFRKQTRECCLSLT
jgi:hypothetical protein